VHAGVKRAFRRPAGELVAAAPEQPLRLRIDQFDLIITHEH
jgi:hypothetical protein